MEMIKNIPVHMDYVGQGRAEKLYQIIIVLFGAVGLGWGYTIQQFSQTVQLSPSPSYCSWFSCHLLVLSAHPSLQVYILGAGLVLASLLTIPPWGIYR